MNAHVVVAQTDLGPSGRSFLAVPLDSPVVALTSVSYTLNLPNQTRVCRHHPPTYTCILTLDHESGSSLALCKGHLVQRASCSNVNCRRLVQ